MRLSMSICDEIKIAMIAIDETMILEINATIALHSDLKLINDRVSSAIKAKKSAKKCAARSGFNVIVSNSQEALPCKTILDTTQATISLKNRRFDGKRATKPKSTGTHTHRGSIET